MTFQEIKNRFNLGRKILPVIVVLFLISGFTPKVDFSDYYLIYYNGNLLGRVDDVGEAQIRISTWQSGDTLKIFRVTDTFYAPSQFTFQSTTDSSVVILNTKEQELNSLTFVNVTPEILNKDCNVFVASPFFPDKKWYIFKLFFGKRQ
jgi:hypothetical protein